MPRWQWAVDKMSDEPEQFILRCMDLETSKNVGMWRMPLEEDTLRHLEREKRLSRSDLAALIEKARENYRQTKKG
jgi:hypothetical protein